jgi:DNA-binding transcriptional LysR family regulator
MELKWLEDFVALARSGSFSRAANLRNVTQPALSRRIRALEDWIGVPLIDRSNYPITLTQLGKQFLPNAEDMVRQATGLRDDFRLLHRPPGTSIRILSLHTLSTTLVPQIVSAFLKHEPKTSVSMVANIQGVDDHFDALSSGTVDFLFAYGHVGIIERAVREGGLQHLTLTHGEFLPVASPARLKAWGPAPLAREKGTIPYLSISAPSFSEKLLAPMVRRFAGKLTLVCEDTLHDSLRAMAIRGSGLAWLPSNIIEDDLAAGRLMVLDDPSLRVPFEIRVYGAAEMRSHRAQRLWAFMAEHWRASSDGLGSKTADAVSSRGPATEAGA